MPIHLFDVIELNILVPRVLCRAKHNGHRWNTDGAVKTCINFRKLKISDVFAFLSYNLFFNFFSDILFIFK